MWRAVLLGGALVAVAGPACSLGEAAADSVPIRGVTPEAQAQYSKGFTCLQGGRVVEVLVDRINDDFCDCDDGTDEPGTSACSHVLGSRFYCHNGGFFSKHVHTSLLNDGICDCCDGSDEFDPVAGAAACANTCKADAAIHRHRAEEHLATVRAGHDKRREALKSVVSKYFADAKESDVLAEKTLVSLALLKDRVAVHLAREERREKKMRLDVARQRQAEERADESASKGSHEAAPGETDKAVECVPKPDEGKVCPDDTQVQAGEFESVDALEMTEDETVAGVEDDPEKAAERDNVAADEATGHHRLSMIELSDGTKLSLSAYLRMDHTVKMFREPRRTPDEMRRKDFLGPLFNGNAEDRKRIGVYALRVMGIVLSPVRFLVQAIAYVPRLVWGILNDSTIVSPYLEYIPSVTTMVQSPRFRRLAGGQVYSSYMNVAWGAQIVWDAPVVAYRYLFPELDHDLKLPEAESLRRAMTDIDADMDKLRREQETRKKDVEFDFGPDSAYYALKDQCIEKKVEKYTYKWCPFQEVKQDYTNLGRWEGWGLPAEHESPPVAPGGHDTTKDSRDYSVMRFTKGQRCWNGPERSVTVKIECGAENEILGVDEPSTCVYEMTVRSFLACTPRDLERAQVELSFWSK